MPKNSCIMQIWAEPEKSALPICNYLQILYQFLTFTQNLKRSLNANRLQVHTLAYNIFNWFRRLLLSANMRKQRIDTVRLKLLKIAAKVVHSAGYITFKLCSSCPYKNEFYETLSNIGKLNVQLE